MAGLSPIKVRCDHCGSEPEEHCRTATGKQRSAHAVRWDTLAHMHRTMEMEYEILDDQPRFGLNAGDRVVCVDYPLDSKVTVLRRISDGFEPGCNQYNHMVSFVRFL